ncbi:MAG TPA: hypothetical protein DC049_11495, partial [Spirochaetia bacterium]|nr:hypothetical protein [Spirochaetia bacterium]
MSTQHYIKPTWKFPVFQRSNFMGKLANLFKNGTIFMPFIVVKSVKQNTEILQKNLAMLINNN